MNRSIRPMSLVEAITTPTEQISQFMTAHAPRLAARRVAYLRETCEEKD